MVETVSEPRWCDGQHKKAYRVHSRNVATLQNEFTQDAVEVALVQYGNDAPVVAITLAQDHEDVISHVAPTTAVALADAFVALGQGGTLIDALREASETLDHALDHPGVVIVDEDEL